MSRKQTHQKAERTAPETKLLPRIHNGAVVLLHSTSTTNAEILDELLTKWKDMGYTFTTVETLFG
jgi:peptidoglycan-N-acetylmuramic acid deacetylase